MLRTRPERIRRARYLLGLTQDEAAELAGISVTTYWRIESGKGTGSLKTLHTIAKVLSVPFEYIVELDVVA